jgi:DNA-binding Lrp family transcriptional regulator
MKKGLTKNEKKVLYGLVRYPTLNDRRLSEKMKVKHSTITAIRRRLHEEGFFRTVRIPAVNRLGYELTVVGYGNFNPSASENERNRYIEKLKEENKGLYFFLTSPDFYFFVSSARNYTQFRRWSDATNFAFADSNLFNGTKRDHVVLPYETTRFVTHFDYSPPLGNMFGIGESPGLEDSIMKVDARRLSRKEEAVLRGLVQNPELTDVALSEKIDASRQVISNMKRRFEKAKLIRTARVVDLKKLGYEIYAFGRLMFSSNSPIKVRIEGIQKASKVVPQFLNLSGNYETVACSAFRSYDEFFKTRKSILGFYAGKDFRLEGTEAQLVALSESRIPVNCDFSSLINEAVTGKAK